MLAGKTATKVLLCLVPILTVCNGQNSPENETGSKFPHDDICGKSPVSIQKTIIGGKIAELGSYPWMASVRYKRVLPPGKSSWGCGGSLITDQHVITAAHCLHASTLTRRVGTIRETWKVESIRLGVVDLTSTATGVAAFEDFEVEDIIIHPLYNNNIKVNDIGIIKLKKKVQFTVFKRPICLPPDYFKTLNIVSDWPKIAGWGNTVANLTNNKRDNQLREASIEIKDTEECRKNITSVEKLKEYIIDKNVICASADGIDACQGDSGGPMMYYYKSDTAPIEDDGNWIIIGIVSYGYGCAKDGFPAVYTRVSEYMDWIFDNVKL